MIKWVRSFAVVILGIILFASCQKQETLIGRKIIPGGDFLNSTFTDTLTLKTKTIREDSILTESSAKYVLGSMDDKVFGHSYAGIYTQMILSSNGISFNDTAFIDSMVLSLNLAGYYGDTNSYHNLRVFRLTDSMSIYSPYQYKSTKTFAREASPIGQKLNYRIGKITLDSSFKDIDGSNFGPSLRITLNSAVGQDILNQTATGAFADDIHFHNYFKGLYIDEDTSLGFSNNMIYVNLTGGQSYVGVYYHTPKTSANEMRLFTNSNAVNSNYFNHNYQNKIVQTALANATSAVDTSVYVQSMQGVKTLIQVPYLSKLGSVLINKAEIEVTMAQSNIPDSAIYAPPASMELLVADTLGRNTETIDQTFANGLPLYGGRKFYFTDATGHKYLRYKFSIAGELQQMLDNKYINNGFYLITFPSNQIADRIIIGGGNRKGDPYQMRLNLVYTKIP